MTCDFTSFSTEFQSYQYNDWVIVKGCVKWNLVYHRKGGWSGGAKVLGKLSVLGHPTILIIVGQGPTAFAVGVGGGLFGHFYSHLSFLSSFSLSLGDRPI